MQEHYFEKYYKILLIRTNTKRAKDSIKILRNLSLYFNILDFSFDNYKNIITFINNKKASYDWKNQIKWTYKNFIKTCFPEKYEKIANLIKKEQKKYI